MEYPGSSELVSPFLNFLSPYRNLPGIMPHWGAARFFIDLCRYSVIMEDDGCDTKYSHHTILEESKKEDLSYAETQKARA
jgi:hypothetical protein